MNWPKRGVLNELPSHNESAASAPIRLAPRFTYMSAAGGSIDAGGELLANSDAVTASTSLSCPTYESACKESPVADTEC